MLETRRGRALGVLVLLAGLFGLTVWYGSLGLDPSVWALPGADELGADYGTHVGERVALWGRVVATEPVTVGSFYGNGRTFRLRLVGLDDATRVAVGDRLNVYAVAEPDRTLRVLDAVVIPAWGVRYTYSISFLAGLWVLGRIGRQWRLDPRTLSLHRRSTPVEVRSWLAGRLAGSDERA